MFHTSLPRIIVTWLEFPMFIFYPTISAGKSTNNINSLSEPNVPNVQERPSDDHKVSHPPVQPGRAAEMWPTDEPLIP